MIKPNCLRSWERATFMSTVHPAYISTVTSKCKQSKSIAWKSNIFSTKFSCFLFLYLYLYMRERERERLFNIACVNAWLNLRSHHPDLPSCSIVDCPFNCGFKMHHCKVKTNAPTNAPIGACKWNFPHKEIMRLLVQPSDRRTEINHMLNDDNFC